MKTVCYMTGMALIAVFLLNCRGGILYKANYYSDGGKKRLRSFFRDKDNVYVLNGREQAWYRDGKTMYVTEFRSGLRHGVHKIWYPNGKIWVRAKYYHGFLISEKRLDTLSNQWTKSRYTLFKKKEKDSLGIRETIYSQSLSKDGLYGDPKGYYRQRYENGGLACEYYRFNGHPHGQYRRWHFNGRIAASGWYLMGKQVGLWRAWYGNGQPNSLIIYRDNMLHGQKIQWYPNGQIKLSETYQLNKLFGVKRSWYSNGNLREESYYNNDSMRGPFTFWYPSGQKMSFGQARNGQWDGMVKHWFPDGTLKTQGKYKLGKLWGRLDQWYDSGIKSAEGNYVDGLLHGQYRWWTLTGKLISIKKFSKGKELWDSQVNERRKALGAEGTDLPMGVKGFSWGMTSDEVKANVLRQGGVTIQARDTLVVAKLPAGHTGFSPIAQSRFSFNPRGELYEIVLDFEKTDNLGSFEFAVPFENWLKTSLGVPHLQPITNQIPGMLVKSRLWGRYRWNSISGDRMGDWRPVVQIEAYVYKGENWVGLSLTNHLTREYGRDTTTVLEGPFYDS